MKFAEQLEPRWKMVVYLASLEDEENAFELYRFIPQELEKPLVEATRQLLSLPKKERERGLKAELKKIIHSEHQDILAQINPGWFLEVLKQESPLLISLILKNLPSDSAKFILEKLSPEIREKLPGTEKQISVSSEWMDIVKSCFESRFPLRFVPSLEEQTDLPHFYFLKTEQWLVFLRELGVNQLAKAFQGVDRSAFKALMHRLSLRDAKELQAQAKQLSEVSSRELKEAQMLLLALPVDTLNPEELFLEVGIAFFTKGLVAQDEKFVQALQYKLPPKTGYLLKRYVENKRMTQKTSVSSWIRKQLIDKLAEVSLH